MSRKEGSDIIRCNMCACFFSFVGLLMWENEAGTQINEANEVVVDWAGARELVCAVRVNFSGASELCCNVKIHESFQLVSDHMNYAAFALLYRIHIICKANSQIYMRHSQIKLKWSSLLLESLLRFFIFYYCFWICSVFSLLFYAPLSVLFHMNPSLLQVRLTVLVSPLSLTNITHLESCSRE